MYSLVYNKQVSHRIAEEYHWAVTHNFKQYIYLGLKTGRWEQERILLEIWNIQGYIAHKIMKYNGLWSHIYIKFENNHLAKEAVDYFRNLDSNLNAEIADNLLCSWYIYEYMIGYIGQGTTAYVDAAGIGPHCMNPMTEPILSAVLKDFGQPEILSIREATAQILFSSMAEALSACIAHGEWEKNGIPYSQFYFSVKIVGCEKEETLISRCLSQENVGSAANEAFRLDYFVDPKDVAWFKFQEYLNSCNSQKEASNSKQSHASRHKNLKISNCSISPISKIPTENLTSRVLGRQSITYVDHSDSRSIVFNDYGTPLGTIPIGNSYENIANGSNVNCIPTVFRELDVPNATREQNILIKDYYETCNGAVISPTVSANNQASCKWGSKVSKSKKLDSKFKKFSLKDLIPPETYLKLEAASSMNSSHSSQMLPSENPKVSARAVVSTLGFPQSTQKSKAEVAEISTRYKEYRNSKCKNFLRNGNVHR